MTERLEIPGEIVENPNEIVQQFRGAFRKKKLADFRIAGVLIGGEDQPSHVAFDEPKTKLLPTDLPRLTIPEDHPVYCYAEYPSPGRLKKLSWSEWLWYVESRAIWDHPDTYAFDDTFSWCIAYTHETSGKDDLIYQTGDLPQVRLP